MTPKGEVSPIVVPPTADAQVLADERRRAVYLYVSKAGAPVTTNEVADAFDIHRNAAKHHLDRLLEAGLLKAEFKRVNGKKGPGAGRPSKLYSSTDTEVCFTLPERHYDLLAHLLLTAMTQGDDLEVVGERFGNQLAASQLEATPGAGAADVVERVLDNLGFAPDVEVDVDGHFWITTQNCPFGWVAVEASEGQVCRLDRSIIAGVLAGAGAKTTVKGHATIASGGGTCIREAVPQQPSDVAGRAVGRTHTG